MSRSLLRSFAGAAVVVLIGAAVVLAERPRTHTDVATQQDEATPQPSLSPTPQEKPAMIARTTPNAVPAIDLAAPKKVETATFALG